MSIIDDGTFVATITGVNEAFLGKSANQLIDGNAFVKTTEISGDIIIPAYITSNDVAYKL